MLASPSRLDPALRADPWPYVAEVTHRTLNDYCRLLVALDRASSRVTDAGAGQLLEALEEQVLSSARAYRVLSPPRSGGERRLDEQLQELCAALTTSILPDRKVGLTLACEPVSVDAQRAWQVCVIVSELVSNAAQHAFAGKRAGKIVIDLRISATDEIVCSVIDDGSASPSPSVGCGTGIVDTLAADLGGGVTRVREAEGLAVVLRVPRNDVRGP